MGSGSKIANTAIEPDCRAVPASIKEQQGADEK